MLKHKSMKETKPSRVVILGAKGFVGTATTKRLLKDGVEVVALGRQELDLQNEQATEKLLNLLQAEDVLVVTSAKAPCKNYVMLLENVAMMKSVCDALAKKPVKQVIYISSDAVYADSMQKLSEASPAAPTSLHGVMHLAREQMLASVVPAENLVVLRPSLLYGADDPHNGYGPNSFYRLASAGEAIKLFGNGEEERDHVYIKDVAEIIRLCVLHQSHGVLNITTGEVISFNDIAQQVKALFNESVEIKCSPRCGPIPHNGYRAFDASNCKKAFPEFCYTLFNEGVLKIYKNCLR